MIIDIHMLQTHPASNPNRDDLGAPKRTVFGGQPRARISSQCIKRSIRTHESFQTNLAGHTGTRTVYFPELIKNALAETDIPEADHDAIVAACEGIAQEEKKTTATKVEDDADSELDDERKRTAQLIFLSPTEANAFVGELAVLRDELPDAYRDFLGDAKAKPKKKDATTLITRLRGVFKHDAADIALFGRMTTSNYFENVEAAMQVAHAISTDAVVPDVDYYTAVDDLKTKEQTGSAFLDELQFSSATYYKYFSLNVELLRANLGDNAELVEKTVRAFLDAAFHAIPSGKRNSFANNNLPDAILIEARDRNVPVSYANAFLKPAANYTDSGENYSVLDDSVRKLRVYAANLGRGYALDSRRWWFALNPTPPTNDEQDFGPEEIADARSIPELIDAVAQALGARAHA